MYLLTCTLSMYLQCILIQYFNKQTFYTKVRFLLPLIVWPCIPNAINQLLISTMNGIRSLSTVPRVKILKQVQECGLELNSILLEQSN